MSRPVASLATAIRSPFLALLTLTFLYIHPSCALESSSPTTILASAAPDGTTYRLYQTFVTWSDKIHGKQRSRTETLYYLVLEDSHTGVQTRIWEQGYGIDARRLMLFAPTGFTLHFVDDDTSPIVLAYWERKNIHLFRINPKRARKAQFERLVNELEGKESTTVAWDIKRRYPPLDVPAVVQFKALLPHYDWDPVAGNPPRITNIWRDKEGWHMTIAATDPEMHLLLRDAAKEWVWVNKP